MAPYSIAVSGRVVDSVFLALGRCVYFDARVEGYVCLPHVSAMRLLIAIKRVIDFNVKVRVKTDGSRRRHRQRQDVDESLRRNRRGGGGAAEGEGDRHRESSPCPAACGLPGDAAHRAGASAPIAPILVETDVELQPLAVAKLLKALVDKEQPQIVILGKQAIDDDANQTGQMLAALLDWPQATFASKVDIADGAATVKREVDGGLETLETEAAGGRHDRSAPERAALRDAAEHHEGEEEAAGDDHAGDAFSVDVAPRLATLKVVEPPKRKGGGKVADVRRAGGQAAQRSQGHLTPTASDPRCRIADMHDHSCSPSTITRAQERHAARRHRCAKIGR